MKKHTTFCFIIYHFSSMTCTLGHSDIMVTVSILGSFVFLISYIRGSDSSCNGRVAINTYNIFICYIMSLTSYKM